MRRWLPVLLGLAALLPASCGGGREEGVRVLAEGDPAPPFRLPSAEGRTVSLEEFRGKRPVLLYFSMGPG